VRRALRVTARTAVFTVSAVAGWVWTQMEYRDPRYVVFTCYRCDGQARATRVDPEQVLLFQRRARSWIAETRCLTCRAPLRGFPDLRTVAALVDLGARVGRIAG
jgi:hypothetical protein